MPASLRRRQRRDRGARWLVTAGGIAIIACVLGMFVFLVTEAAPLLSRAEVRLHEEIPLAVPSAILAVAGDEARTHTALLGADGVVRVIRHSDRTVALERDLARGARVVAGAPVSGSPGFVLATGDGRARVVGISFDVEHARDGPVVRPRLEEPVEVLLDEGGAPLVACAASGRGLSSGIAAVRADGSLVVAETAIEENLFSGERTVVVEQWPLESPAPLRAIVLDTRRDHLFGATPDGRLLWWRLRDGDRATPQVVDAGAPITVLTLLIGDQSLMAGHEDGTISKWTRVTGSGPRPVLTRVKDFVPLSAPVRAIAPSARDRSFLAQDDAGSMALCHATSGRVLWTGASPRPDATAIAFAPKGNGASVASTGTLALLDVDCRHPDAGLGAFFGKVWYEGYAQPAHVWQSSSGSDEAEPKYGLVPLLFGTFKATLFSLLFAVPLALLAAMYTSQFMHPSLRRWVKPTVEIMASVPSVVLGFLAGLWLAPRVAQFLLGLPLFVLIFPPAILAAGALGDRLPRPLRLRFPDGFASIALIAVAAIALTASLLLSRPLEVACFGGDFVRWMQDAAGIAYDPKNCIVLGIAMGVAVVPIIFSIAEDAFSNVPQHLVSGSLALGASRWHTVTRVVLPTASPGLFSAVMIGFGRAVGETMIVVMASGNTPIMDGSIFNGLRSLSANIATEIPEAAQGGTLYRTLFVAALLLFAVTFAVNTLAEIVRQRLRARYGRL